MAGLGAKDILKNITALEQLIEEINFQRAKEMRQCLMSRGSDSSFLMVQGTTYWTDLFVRHFLFQTDRSTDADDLLFFIRKKHMKGSRYVPKYHTEVEVYRKDSRKLPIGDPDVDWEETVYLNLIIHQFDYTLTLAICTRTSPKELQVLKRHSQKVYASPSQRRMDTKGEVEEITYPNVCFHVDNFDEVFADMLVRDGEMVCVELVASDHSGSRQAVIFLGSIRYDALKRVYDARASLSSKVAQRMMLALFSGSGTQRIEFVRMKGPQGKGHAEMAVLKPKGSGVETPTSEPGVSLTDLWDADWDDEPEDRFLYRHQRRLSDPSANFNTFINAGWRTRSEGRSRSENEGLDNFADGVYEIESGDVRDAVCSSKCCSMLACTAVEEEMQNPITPPGVCMKCKHFHGYRRQNLLQYINSDHVDNLKPIDPSSFSEKDLAYSNKDDCTKVAGRMDANEFNNSKSNSDEEISSSCSSGDENAIVKSAKELNVSVSENNPKKSLEESFTVTEMNSSMYHQPHESRSPSPTEEDPFILIDYPEVHRDSITRNRKKKNSKFREKKKTKSRPGSAVQIVKLSSDCMPFKPLTLPLMKKKKKSEKTTGRRSNSLDTYLPEPHLFKFRRSSLMSNELPTSGCYSDNIIREKIFYLDYDACIKKRLISEETLNCSSKSTSNTDKKIKITLPHRSTKDGTSLYYICDLKLDDGAYNPLWTTRGFTQTFHFWKESRRAQSVPLNAYLTYVTLPWFTIITDILDHRTGPILTF